MLLSAAIVNKLLFSLFPLETKLLLQYIFAKYKVIEVFYWISVISFFAKIAAIISSGMVFGERLMNALLAKVHYPCSI